MVGSARSSWPTRRSSRTCSTLRRTGPSSRADPRRTLAYLFCNQCGHRNPPASMFCSSCGAALDAVANRTVTLAKVDPLQDASGPHDDVTVHLDDLAPGVASLVVRTGSQAGEAFPLGGVLTRLGRHPDSEISLDDITV